MEARFDSRFSDSGRERHAVGGRPSGRCSGAELYWITTVRADGRPHVTPLIGVWFDGAMHFTTGLEEQKARNLAANRTSR